MNDNTVKLIEQVAQKLGTNSHYLWNVFIKQAKIESSIALFQFLLISIFGYILFMFHKSLLINKDYNGCAQTGYIYYKDNAIIPMLIGLIIFLLLIMCAIFSLGEFFTCLLNPEYWALQKIFNLKQ